MGQYYMVYNIDKKTEIKHDFDVIGGMKLTEHSYLYNGLALYLRHLLANEWKGERVIQVGDYAEPNDGTNTEKLLNDLYESGEYGKDTWQNPCNSIPIPKKYGEDDIVENKQDIRYIANIDKKVYIDIEDALPLDIYVEKIGKKKNYLRVKCLDPLLLLIACGNGLGGGDYHGYGEENVGLWAGDHLFATNDLDELEGYEKVIYNFPEERFDKFYPDMFVYKKIAESYIPYKYDSKGRYEYGTKNDVGGKIEVISCPENWKETILNFLGMCGYEI